MSDRESHRDPPSTAFSSTPSLAAVLGEFRGSDSGEGLEAESHIENVEAAEVGAQMTLPGDFDSLVGNNEAQYFSSGLNNVIAQPEKNLAYNGSQYFGNINLAVSGTSTEDQFFGQNLQQYNAIAATDRYAMPNMSSPFYDGSYGGNGGGSRRSGYGHVNPASLYQAEPPMLAGPRYSSAASGSEQSARSEQVERYCPATFEQSPRISAGTASYYALAPYRRHEYGYGDPMLYGGYGAQHRQPHGRYSERSEEDLMGGHHSFESAPRMLSEHAMQPWRSPTHHRNAGFRPQHDDQRSLTLTRPVGHRTERRSTLGREEALDPRPTPEPLFVDDRDASESPLSPINEDTPSDTGYDQGTPTPSAPQSSSHRGNRRQTRTRNSSKRVERDPANVAIYELRTRERRNWTYIVQYMNAHHPQSNSKGPWSQAAVYGRFSRNAPRVAASRGNHDFDTKDFLHLRVDDGDKTRGVVRTGRVSGAAEGAAAPAPPGHVCPPVPDRSVHGFSYADDIAFAESLSEVLDGAQLWPELTAKLSERLGREIGEEDIARRLKQL